MVVKHKENYGITGWSNNFSRWSPQMIYSSKWHCYYVALYITLQKETGNKENSG